MGKHSVVLNDAEKRQKYYAVHCRCGHVGPKNYIEIVFAIIASSGKEAAAKARKMARVKHDKKNAIIDCYEISREKYFQIIEVNKNDPYLKCKNIQEQRSIEGFESRVLEEPINVVFKKTKQERKEFVKYKLKKQKQFLEAFQIERRMIYESIY